MNSRIAVTLAFALGMATVAGGQSAPGGDWPQWRGPDRTGLLSRESGLMKQWSASGPALVWSAANLGAGYGSISVSGDRIFVQGMKGRDSVVSILNRADGKPVWSKILGSAVNNEQGPGPRGARNIPWLISESPLIEGNNVIVTPGGRNAGMVALDKMTGKTIWTSKELSDEAGYASVIAGDVQGVRMLMTLTAARTTARAARCSG